MEQTEKTPWATRRGIVERSTEYARIMEACASYVAVEQPTVRDPEKAYKLLRPVFDAATGDAQECFMVLLLNVKNRVMCAPVEIHRGVVDSCPAHPRDVFRAAVREGAAAIILAHNHLSGEPTPSREDIDVTRRLVDSAKILGIRITDHIIVVRPSASSPGYVSLREKGLVEFN